MARRLAAILAADVVGYSRLMSKDEAGTLRAVKNHHKEVFDPEVARHGGRIVKLMGDGVLVEFPSVVDAVQCAIAVQDRMAAASDRGIKLRIGVTLGDIIIDADDIFGNGVNVAARLQEMAEPGGICISGTVFEQVEGKVDHRFVDLGTQQIKNIPKPIHVYGDFARVMTNSKEAKRRPLLDAVVDSETDIQATGGCLCGDIRYEIIKPAIDSGYCHCKMCQRFSGAPVIVGVTLPKDGIRFIKGKLTYYRSSTIAERGFCPRCGSSLAYRPVARRWNEWIFIFVGSFDEGFHFPPEWHLGVESHVPWLSIRDELQGFAATNPPVSSRPTLTRKIRLGSGCATISSHQRCTRLTSAPVCFGSEATAWGIPRHVRSGPSCE